MKQNKDIEKINKQRGAFISTIRILKKKQERDEYQEYKKTHRYASKMKPSYTQQAMAEKLDMEPESYSRLETKGQGLDSVYLLKLISEILEIDILELINIDDKE